MWVVLHAVAMNSEHGFDVVVDLDVEELFGAGQVVDEGLNISVYTCEVRVGGGF